MSHTKPVREGDTRRCPECGGFQVLVPVGSYWDHGDMSLHVTEWRCINSPLGHRESGPLTDSTKQNEPRGPSCSTCRHWDKDRGARCFDPKYHSLPTGEFGACGRDIGPDSLLVTSGEDIPANGAQLLSYEQVTLLTGPDFGCVNHESKETT